MFKTRSAFIALLAFAACSTLAAQAADGVFTAAMDGAQNQPNEIKTPATGKVELRVSADGKKIEYRVTVDKISNPSQVDLHLGSAAQNGPAVVKLWPRGGAAAKRGEFSGVLAEGSIDSGDFAGSMAGSPMSDLLDEIRAGNAYVNVHTYDGTDPPYSGPGDYRLGEIRGQLQ